MGRKPQPIAYHLTMPTAEGKPFFALPEHAAAVAEVVRGLRAKGIYRLFAYAVLPDRLELLIAPTRGDDLRTALYELRLQTGQALRKRGIAANFWAPRSEIKKLFDPQEAAALILGIQQLPVDAGLAPNPESFRFSSASPEADVDDLSREPSGAQDGEYVMVSAKPSAVPA